MRRDDNQHPMSGSRDGENVTVKGGTIRGFLTGVRIVRELNPRRGRFARVVQMTILETTKGIELDGRFSVASDNTIERTGLGIIIRHGTAERNTILGASRGIDMRRGVIRDNTLMGVGPVAVSIVYGVCSGNVAQGFATLGCEILSSLVYGNLIKRPVF